MSNYLRMTSIYFEELKISTIVTLSLLCILVNICIVIGIVNAFLHCIEFKKWYSRGIKIITPEKVITVLQ